VNVILLCDSTVYSCDTVITWSVLSSLLWWFLYCKFFMYSIVALLNCLMRILFTMGLLLTNIQHYSWVQLTALGAHQNSTLLNSPSTAASLFHMLHRRHLQQDCLRQASAHNSRSHSPAVYLIACWHWPQECTAHQSVSLASPARDTA
jgi:hypothetical protein